MTKRAKGLEFMAVWNAANSVEEVVEETGYTYSTVLSKASVLRSLGFDLKKFATPEFMAKIGAKGGRNGHTGGFFANRELASSAGKKGGRVSRRKK